MSTFMEKQVVCAVCGKTSVQTELGSCSVFGEPDLDFRPAEMLRSTMEAWVQECPHCGYVAVDIQKKPRLKETVLRQLYADAKGSGTLPELALTFEKYALYLERRKDLAGSIRHHLCAAWVCDDEEDKESAARLRVRCLALVDQLLPKHHTKRKRRKYLLLKADLLRRIGNSDVLRQMSVDDRSFDYASREIMCYQKELAERHDYAAHSQAEIDLEEYDDFFEKKSGTRADCSIRIRECIRQALSTNAAVRGEALSELKQLRPRKFNAPYDKIGEIIDNHSGSAVYYGDPLGVDQLAPLINVELIELLESFVVAQDTCREKVTEENILAMSLLHELYKSPYLPDEYREQAQAQQHRTYFMHVDHGDEDDHGDHYLTLIQPQP